ncbi:MAG: UDP-N-acetylmuramoyl-L-alanyl-D-glutamate--2,6-diaminopimelate ligase [Candidatus Gracilibacteria bacterium]
MTLIQKLKHGIGLRNPARVAYHYLRGRIAFALSGNPAKDMYIIGVTGTKGKTTTSTLIARALEESGRKTALLSTAQIWIAGEKRENQSKMTMDNPFDMWKTLEKARAKGVTHLVLETSSHGIYYFRNFGIRYNAVVLTNISQDHLDLHGTMDEYARTKARIFQKEPGKICVLPKDCEYFSLFQNAARAGGDGRNIITYSMKEPADYQLRALRNTEKGMDIDIKGPDEEALIQAQLKGVFNAENILAAYTLLRSIGVANAHIIHAWADFTGVPGRLEPVPNALGLTILIDYAHTEASLRSVLQTLQTDGRMILIFGATGDRDTSKRPKMGAVAHELADTIILTDDDTYSESSERIISMLREGIPRSIGDTFQIIPDRRDAIYWALQHAEPGDTVLVAGKGCETVQVTNQGPIPWSDRGIVEEFLGTQ